MFHKNHAAENKEFDNSHFHEQETDHHNNHTAFESDKESPSNEPHVLLEDHDHIRTRKKRTGCMGRIQKRKRCCGICCLLFILAIVGIGLTLFFVFPRIKFAGVTASESNPGQGLTVDGGNIAGAVAQLVGASPSNPFTASLAITLAVKIQSESYIDYRFDQIVLQELFIVDPTSGNKKYSLVAKGAIVDAVVPRSTISTQVLPLNATYTTTSRISALASDPTIQALAEYCGNQIFGLPATSKSGKIEFQYSVRFESPFASFVAWFYPPVYSSNFQIPCPKSATDLLGIVQDAIGR